MASAFQRLSPPPRPLKERWGQWGLGLLVLGSTLQAVGFSTPGWLRKDNGCGNTGLVYAQNDVYVDGRPLGVLRDLSKHCIYQSIVKTWKETDDSGDKLDREFGLANDIIRPGVSMLLCGLAVLLLVLPVKRVVCLGVAIQVLAIASVLQWDLVYSQIVKNISASADDFPKVTILFPYSLFLFGLGAIVTDAVAIILIIVCVRHFKTEDKVDTLEPSTGTLEPSTGTLEPSTGTLEPSTSTMEPGTVTMEPGTVEDL